MVLFPRIAFSFPETGCVLISCPPSRFSDHRQAYIHRRLRCGPVGLPPGDCLHADHVLADVAGAQGVRRGSDGGREGGVVSQDGIRIEVRILSDTICLRMTALNPQLPSHILLSCSLFVACLPLPPPSTPGALRRMILIPSSQVVTREFAGSSCLWLLLYLQLCQSDRRWISSTGIEGGRRWRSGRKLRDLRNRKALVMKMERWQTIEREAERRLHPVKDSS